jgi:hypothetical protein
MKSGVGACDHTFIRRSKTSLVVPAETTLDRPVFLSTIIRAEEYAFHHRKAPHSSGGIEAFLVHEKQEKCCIGGNSELLARLFFVPHSSSNVASSTGKDSRAGLAAPTRFSADIRVSFPRFKTNDSDCNSPSFSRIKELGQNLTRHTSRLART